MVEGPVAQRLAQGLQTNGVARAVEVTPFRPILPDSGLYWLVYYYYNYAMAIKW